MTTTQSAAPVITRTCTYCGATGEHVRPEVVHVGGHAGTQQRNRCTTAHPVYGWVYAHVEA